MQWIVNNLRMFLFSFAAKPLCAHNIARVVSMARSISFELYNVYKLYVLI